MATGTNGFDPEDDDLASSFFQQPGQQPGKPTGSLTSPTGQPVNAGATQNQDLTSSMFDPMGAASPTPNTGVSQTPQATTDWANTGTAATTTAAPSATSAFANNLPQTTQPAGVSQPTGGAGDASSSYATQVQQLQTITDPQQRAVAQDALARSMYADLQSAGHDVKWSGSQLIVDGRPYEVAGTPITDNPNGGVAGGIGTSVSGPGMPGENTPSAPAGAPTGAAATSAGAPYTGGTYGAVPSNVEGVDAGKWADPNKHDTKYDVLHLLSQAGSVDAAWPQIQQLYPNAQRVSGDVIDFGDGFGPVDVQRDYDGGGGFHWEPTSGAGGQAPTPGTTTPTATTNAPGAGGVNLTTPPNPLTTAPTYTPGDVTTDDIPKASYTDLMAQMGPDYTPTPVSGSTYQASTIDAHDPGAYDFGGFGDMPSMDVGQVGQSEDDLVNSVLQHPESIDAQTLARLKAKGRQDQADLYDQEQGDLTAAGYANGISDSNWMASQKLQSRRDRDASVMKNNQDAEITAATTNAADRRSAATLGSQYVSSKGNLKLAQRGQTFTEAQAGESNKQASAASQLQRAQYLTGVDTANATQQLQAAQLRAQSDTANNTNLFNAAKLRQDKVISTVNADISAAAATTNRMQLQEQTKQAATDLGISQEKVMSQWLESQMADATQRYGIDTSADMDQLKLHTADKEFMSDLAFKYAQLAQQDDQFGANLGLQTAGLQVSAQDSANNTALRAMGL
jgi:hypothetical protein